MNELFITYAIMNGLQAPGIFYLKVFRKETFQCDSLLSSKNNPLICYFPCPRSSCANIFNESQTHGPFVPLLPSSLSMYSGDGLNECLPTSLTKKEITSPDSDSLDLTTHLIHRNELESEEKWLFSNTQPLAGPMKDFFFILTYGESASSCAAWKEHC